MILQSFWSWPMLHGNFYQHGCFQSYRHLAMSWSLSCLQAHKFHERVVLVTDELGRRLLVDYLQLPYAEVIQVLDQIDRNHLPFYVNGKIRAYAEMLSQERSFTHIDGDMYLWKPIPEEILNAPLACQNCEGAEVYRGVYERPTKFIRESNIIAAYHDRDGDLGWAPCMGLFSCSDMDFLSTYCEYVQGLLDQTEAWTNLLNRFDFHSAAIFNCSVEQLSLGLIADSKKKNIKFWMDGQSFREVDIEAKAKENMAHLMSQHSKGVQNTNERLSARLQKMYPDVHARILSEDFPQDIFNA